ncbi:MAG: stage III sporulation protein AF [Lachnospiraceae bacterium]|jgi:stage III sporulation protein AF|nr:stage III sporulation protein AF [Lachnospiraceae bacterium]
MIEALKSWSQAIIIAIIIGTIIEMILPNNNNKKYVTTVIGVFIVFTIISPIVSSITGKTIDISPYIDISQYNSSQTYNANVIAESDKNVEKLYLSNIKQNIQISIEEQNYKVNSLDVSVNTKEEGYGEIVNINADVSEKESSKNSTIEPVNKVKIGVGEKKNDEEEQVSQEKIEELKTYISENYGVDIKKIHINEGE